jgi:hypothetical protein
MYTPNKRIGCLLFFLFLCLQGNTQQGNMYSALEINIYPTRPNAIFSRKHPIGFMLVAKNNLNTAQEGVIAYEIKNKVEDILQTGKMKLQITAGKTFKQRFNINFYQPGKYRIDFDIIFPNYTEKQTGKITYQ